MSPDLKSWVAMEAVETNVPPPRIVGLVPASKTEEKFLLTSQIPEAPERGTLRVTETNLMVPSVGMAVGLPIEVVAAEALLAITQVGQSPSPRPETEAPEA